MLIHLNRHLLGSQSWQMEMKRYLKRRNSQISQLRNWMIHQKRKWRVSMKLQRLGRRLIWMMNQWRSRCRMRFFRPQWSKMMLRKLIRMRMMPRRKNRRRIMMMINGEHYIIHFALSLTQRSKRKYIRRPLHPMVSLIFQRSLLFYTHLHLRITLLRLLSSIRVWINTLRSKPLLSQ